MLNFLKYYDGARPSKAPQKKRPPTVEVKSSEKRSNYVRPDRSFNPSWQNGRSWLTFADDKLVGMGSDGASNMIGSKTGLATRLKEDFPEMISVHCLCHQLELAFRDVFRKATLYDKCMTLLISLHYFYLKPKQKTGLVQTMKFLASHGNAKAEGLVRMVLDRHLVAFMIFLQNLLVPLQKLSLQLQRSNAALSDVLRWTEATTEMLQDCKKSQCKDLQEVLEQGSYRDVKLRGSCPAMTYKSDLVDKTMKAIEDRFIMQHSESAKIFAATKIACLQSWPSVEDSKDFGDSDIHVIFRQFSNTLTSAGITKDGVDQEWRLMKKILYKRFVSNLPQQKWTDIHRQFSEQFSEILVLMDLLQSLPPTSVSCEASFSQMKLIKTSRRCRMRQSTLNTLMTVKLHAPSITDFDPEKAIDRWLVTPTRARSLSNNRDKHSQSAVKTSEVICAAEEKDVEDAEEQEDEEESDTEEEIAVFNKAIERDEDSDYCSDFADEEQTFAKIMNYYHDY
ncbi:zinc finger protein 862-like [Haliotis asinina]|uniref:zinc finger protein 862-like n=1 Tax=Haliotis asinina TaxID=109174 RepID=UPI003531F4FA